MSVETAPNGNLTAAIDYLNRGWSPLALCPPDHVGIGKWHTDPPPEKRKHPCTSPGKAVWHAWKQCQTEPLTEDQLNDKFNQVPRSNVGIALGPVSGLVRVDVDGEEGRRFLAEVSGGVVPHTLKFQSGGGGEGLLFRIPPGVELRTTKHSGEQVHSEIRFQGPGAQTVLPPSMHSSGRRYEWVQGCGPDDTEAAMMPGWLVEKMRVKPKEQSSTSYTPDREHDRTVALAALGALSTGRCDDHDDWVAVGMALHSVDMGLLGEWDDWSRGSAKYRDGECAGRWASFDGNGGVGNGGVGIGSLIAWARQDSPGWEPPRRRQAATNGQSLRSYKHTDLGNSERFVDMHGDGARYCHPFKTWLIWDGRRFVEDAEGRVVSLAKRTVRQIWNDVSDISDDDKRKAMAQHAAKSEAASRIHNLISLAQSALPILPEKLDTDPWALNCPNGTVDLRTGDLRPHRRSDYLTKLCPTKFDPEAETYDWDRFVESVFDGDGELIEYVQRVFGSALAGVSTEHILPILWGVGANGKTTFIETIMSAIGPDYAVKCPSDLLVAKRNESHPTEKADLFGTRLAVSSETGEGRRLNEALVKELTGGETVTARKMHKDFFQFDPTHTLCLVTNHKPTVRGTDTGIWRRLCLIPFTRVFAPEDQDKSLPERLKRCSAGVLTWLVEGCLNWQRDGLGAAQAVTAATTEYRTAEDTIAMFIADRCEVAEQLECKASDLFKSFKSWCEEANERAPSQTRFGIILSERGFGKRTSNGTWRTGISLRTV